MSISPRSLFPEVRAAWKDAQASSARAQGQRLDGRLPQSGCMDAIELGRAPLLRLHTARRVFIHDAPTASVPDDRVLQESA